jgi:methionyl-tRNA formyltransferase
LLPQAALDALPWWNIHFSLLPKWRGASPLQQSILSGGIGAGVTLFELDAGMDTGPIISSQEVSLGENETTAEALERFTIAGVNLFQQHAGKQTAPTPQFGEATFAPKLNRSTARLNLSDIALSIHRAVMAFNPEPMAWCELDGNPIRILETRSLGSSNWAESPSKGRVSKSSEKILLECSDGSRLELVTVQPAGKQAMAAADWFRGLGVEVHLA